MVLAELSGGVAEILQKLRDCWIFGFEPECRARHADFGEPRADRRLSRDESGPPSGATLLAVEIGEVRAFPGDAVDVGRLVAHDAQIVAAEVKPTDVVGHNKEDIGLRARHDRNLRAWVSEGVAR